MNNAISTRPTRPSNVNMVTDGAGGAIVSWIDFDLATGGYDLYAQRIGANGTLLWNTDGVPVCTNEALQGSTQMIADGSGGAIIVWMDQRNAADAATDIYAQRLDAEGHALWAADGIVVCGEAHGQAFPNLTSDGNGGAIVVWQDTRNGVSNRPFAQRLDANGTPLWTLDGILISPLSTEQPQILADGAGGAFVAWHEFVAGSFDIVAQRVGPGGGLLWGASGVPVCTAPGVQLRPRLVSDASGGVILAWEDYRNTTYSNIYLQRLDSAGVGQWATNGVAAGPNTLDQRDPGVMSDGNGGAFVAWVIQSWGTWSQRIGAGGTRQWASDGIRISDFAPQPQTPRIVTDGGTGAIVSWSDNHSNYDIFAQRVDPSGAIQWTTNGVAVCANLGFQSNPISVADGRGGAILVWPDGRNDATTDTDLYGQHVDANGQLGGTVGVGGSPRPSHDALVQAFPNPCRSETTLRWSLPEPGRVSLEVFDSAGRRVAALASGEFGAGTHARTLQTSRLPAGVYRCRLRVGGSETARAVIVTK